MYIILELFFFREGNKFLKLHFCLEFYKPPEVNMKER